jgi:hypothetical protein
VWLRRAVGWRSLPASANFALGITPEFFERLRSALIDLSGVAVGG